jgi:hypothetical protein
MIHLTDDHRKLLNELIGKCRNTVGCALLEQEIKRLGLWGEYAAKLTGSNVRPDVLEDQEVLWGYSWELRRAAARTLIPSSTTSNRDVL